ncbi:MAG: hypothetical protein K8H86_13250, partial [Ignavibacteriaceae bacterium]|nr:hypothetical protein [Ignavibacteriaceae bacterium]
MLPLPKSLFASIEKSNLFTFLTGEYQFVLAGYPTWKAYVSYRNSNLWVESFFRIDVGKKNIFFTNPKPNIKDELNDHSLLNQLVKSDIEIERQKIAAFFSTIPADIVQAVSQYPDSHWEFIESIILLGPDFLSLINTNPVYAYIVVNSKRINPSIRLLNPTLVLKNMIMTKQKEVLGLCGFP